MIKNELGRLQMHPLPEVTKAKLVLVGEYPTVTEMREGKYFISTGADILNRALEKAEIKLEDCYYTVACCYLISKMNKTIPAVRYNTERARLIDEIRKSGATLVMPLGALATGVLLGKALTITKILGNDLDIPELPGVHIIPNFHPAALLHNPGNYKVFQKVVDTVAQGYKGKLRDPGVTKWEWCETDEAIKALIADCQKSKYGAADIETSGLVPQTDKVWVMGVCLKKNFVRVIPMEYMYQKFDLMQELFDTTMHWIWHHGKFDTSMLHCNQFTKARLDDDTIYLHYAINETNGTHGLGQCATLYLGADEYKSNLNSEFKYIIDEPAYKKYKNQLGERVATDADYTLQLFEELYPVVKNDPNLIKLYDTLLMPGANYLRKVQMRGMKVDVKYLEGLAPGYMKQIEDITKEVQEAAAYYWNPATYMAQTGAKTAGPVFKPTSVKQLAWLVYDKLKLKPAVKKPKRGTGEDVLESITDPPEFILKILKLRKVVKEYKTYVVSYLNCKDKDDIVHPNFNLHITATGRLSCTEPNVQNVPSGKADIRDAFIPRGPGRIWLEIDYSGAELRVLAYVSGDKNLTRALVEGDCHGELAEKIYGDAYINGTAEERKFMRGNAKTVNFGVAYGRQAPNLAETFHISLAEAQNWIDTWAEMFPDAWKYLQGCEADVRSGEPQVTIWGRYRRFGLIHGVNVQDLINEAKNFRIQSTSSDNLLAACIEVDETLEFKYDAFAVDLIHDSVLIDCPADKETVDAVSKLVVGAMTSVPKRYYGCEVPFESDIDLGSKWGTLGAYNIETGMVNYHKKDYTYEEWIKLQGVAI